jgi:hypothetical protein
MKILHAYNFYRLPGGEDTAFTSETALPRQHGHEVVECMEDCARIASANHRRGRAQGTAATIGFSFRPPWWRPCFRSIDGDGHGSGRWSPSWRRRIFTGGNSSKAASPPINYSSNRIFSAWIPDTVGANVRGVRPVRRPVESGEGREDAPKGLGPPYGHPAENPGRGTDNAGGAALD